MHQHYLAADSRSRFLPIQFFLKLMMVKVEFEKGAVGYMHQHYHSQATYVASGKFELTIGDRKEILSTGDGYYVEPDQPHGCVCLEAGVLIDTFSPMRADFLI